MKLAILRDKKNFVFGMKIDEKVPPKSISIARAIDDIEMRKLKQASPELPSYMVEDIIFKIKGNVGDAYIYEEWEY